jgi:hypothetical protein
VRLIFSPVVDYGVRAGPYLCVQCPWPRLCRRGLVEDVRLYVYVHSTSSSHFTTIALLEWSRTLSKLPSTHATHSAEMISSCSLPTGSLFVPIHVPNCPWTPTRRRCGLIVIIAHCRYLLVSPATLFFPNQTEMEHELDSQLSLYLPPSSVIYRKVMFCVT